MNKHKDFVESLRIEVDEVDSTEKLEKELILKFDKLFNECPDEQDDN